MVYRETPYKNMDDLGVPHGSPILGKLQIGEITRNQSDPVPHVWVMLKWLRTKATQFPLWQVPLSDAQRLDIFMKEGQPCVIGPYDTTC